MKKIIITSLLIVFSLSLFCQRENLVNITYSPLHNGLGFFYISKSVNIFDIPISCLTSIEAGEYKNINTKIQKYGLGTSIQIDGFNFNLSLCYNKLETNIPDIAKEFSLEIGMLSQYNKIYPSVTFDPINNEIKLGIGYKF